MPATTDPTPALSAFAGDPRKARDLAQFLGFAPVAAPVDLLSNTSDPVTRFFDERDDRFGIESLFRVGAAKASPGTVGLYIAQLTEWGTRASARDRARRRVARALVDLQPYGDQRSLFILVPNDLELKKEVELVLPRVRIDGKVTGLTTVRALVELQEPNRFHRDLIRRLAIAPGTSLPDVQKQWHHEFSVERATKRFYAEYAAVRDRLAKALKEANPDHPTIAALSEDDARAWATRHLGRILFLWFLQAKGWLGYDGSGRGPDDYLVRLMANRDDSYYRSRLVPLFFEAMGTKPAQRSAEVKATLGEIPYLNGGLFRRNTLEDRIGDAASFDIPDEVYDPQGHDAEGGTPTVYGLLQRYRFTTRESTPDDQSVDPDPELLGRVFENLYQADERHDSGTYYTPREIVQYMCRQVLDGYLCSELDFLDHESIEWLRDAAIDPKTRRELLNEEEKDRVLGALTKLKACDPAVGSGAFLLGMMHEIVQLHEGVGFTKDERPEETQERIQIAKRSAIESSLYGVDINPDAVEICQLRLWLSLVLDLDDPANVDPLPNLDFRIVAGDSLIDRTAELPFEQSLPRGSWQAPLDDTLRRRMTEAFENIKAWREKFDRTSAPKELHDLAGQISRAQTTIVALQIDAALQQEKEKEPTIESKAHGRGERTKEARALKQLRERIASLEGAKAGLDPEAAVKSPFLWPVAFPDVFERGGFDIVLANPPYIRQENLAALEQAIYGKSFEDVYRGTADIIVFFYARAAQLLRDGGWLSFVTSNKYMRAKYGDGVRAYLPKVLRIEQVIDFGDLPLFESVDEQGRRKDVAAYPAILVGQRQSASSEHALSVADLAPTIRMALRDAGETVNTQNVRDALSDLPGLLENTGIHGYPQTLLRKGGWILEDPALVRLFERLMNGGTPLGEYVQDRIYYGIKTGLNEAFVIDDAKRQELLAADPKSAEIIKPWLRGKDIKRWRAEHAGLYLLAVQNSGDASATNPWANAKNEGEARRVFEQTYPAIHDHLTHFETALRNRRDQGRFWWELRACAYYHEFGQPKILWRENCPPWEARFAMDESGAFIVNKLFCIPRASVALCTYLVSPLSLWILDKLASKIRGGWLELRMKEVVGRLPIPEGVEAIPSTLDRSDDALLHRCVSDSLALDSGESELIWEWYVGRQVYRAAATLDEDEAGDD